MDLFIVDSPLQLLNAAEARHHFQLPAESSHVILMEGVSHYNLEQMRNMVATGSWGGVHEVLGLTSESFAPKLRQLDQILRGLRNVDHVFVGEYRSPLMRHAINHLRPRRAFLMDDGAGTLAIHEALKNPPGLSWRDRIKKHVFGLRLDEIPAINYFTAYDLAPHGSEVVVRNAYEQVSAQLAGAERSDAVWFLGACLPESDIVSSAYYMQALAEVARYFADRPLIYVPHRREADDKLRAVEALGFQVTRLDVCAELHLCQSRIVPAAIASFYSAALYNCSVIFAGRTEVVAFVLKPDELRADLRERIGDLYHYYASNRWAEIRVVEAETALKSTWAGHSFGL